MILPSRLTMALGGACAVLLPIVITLTLNLNVAKHDLARLEKAVQARETELVEARADLVTCRANVAGVKAGIDRQNLAIDALRVAGDTAQDQANARTNGARRAAEVAEAQRQVMLASETRAGEDICEAAFRLHKESIR